MSVVPMIATDSYGREVPRLGKDFQPGCNGTLPKPQVHTKAVLYLCTFLSTDILSGGDAIVNVTLTIAG
jgi:hypothetical protein